MRLLPPGVILLAFVLGALPAHAQGIGFQGGFSIDPDQVYGGSHFEHELASQFLIRPSIEGGTGDHVTLATINIDFLYRFPLEGGSWSIYQGGGPAINIFRFDDETDLRGGLNVAFGFSHEGGFFTEFKVGTGDSPNLKFGVGFTIR